MVVGIISLFNQRSERPSDSPETPVASKPTRCQPQIELHSARRYAAELGRPEAEVLASYRVNLWEEPSQLGKGRVVGEMVPGSRATILDRTASGFLVRSRLDGSIGWVSAIHVSREVSQDLETGRPCGKIVVIECPDGTKYVGNQPDKACR